MGKQRFTAIAAIASEVFNGEIKTFAAGSLEDLDDLLQVQRLKKRKLFLRDRIRFAENQLTPDIIA